METIEVQTLKRAFTQEERRTIMEKLESCLNGITEKMECCDSCGRHASFSGSYSDDGIEVLPGVYASLAAEAEQDARITPATFLDPEEVTIVGGSGTLTELTLWDDAEDCEIEVPAGMWDELEKALNEMVTEG